MDFLRIRVLITLGLLVAPGSQADNGPAPSTEDQGYVAPDTCAQCHGNQSDAWSHSDHAWAMRPASEASVLGNFEDALFDDGAVRAEFFRRDDGFWVSIEGENGAVEEYPVAYSFGHFPLQQYLVELSRGRLQALTVAWDSRPEDEGGQRWFSLYPGKQFAPDDALHWTGRYQNWNAMCADCHSTFLSMNYDAGSDSFSTTWQEQSVGCQGCHGPGRAHVDWARNDQSGPGKGPDADAFGLLVDFNGMDPENVVETCAYCHSRRQPLKDGQQAQEAYLDKALPSTLRPDLYHADGQIQGEVYVYGSFIQSAMYKAGVSCLDCHDPHTTKVIAQGNALCTQCHNPAPPSRFPQISPLNYDSPEHHHHPQGSPGAQCVNCHMTEETYMVVDPRRDHSFRVPRPDLALATDSPNACNHCHDDRSPDWAKATVDRWYPLSDRPGHFADALSAFRNAEKDAFIKLAGLIRDRSRPAIARATAAEHLGSFGARGVSGLRSGLLAKEPLVQAYAAGAFAQLVVGDNLGLLVSLLSSDQPRAVRDQALKALAGVRLDQFPPDQRSRIAALREDYESRLGEMATLPGSRFNLATYLHRNGQQAEAINHYQAALRLDPTFAPARVNLATLANERGDNELALQTLEAGAELQTIPDSDRSYLAYLLALVLVEQGQPADALPRFEQATRLDPGNPRPAYNHGLVLARMNRLQEANTVLTAALADHPDNYDLLNATIYVLREQGRPEDALRYARHLQSTYPQDDNAYRLLQALESSLR